MSILRWSVTPLHCYMSVNKMMIHSDVSNLEKQTKKINELIQLN